MDQPNEQIESRLGGQLTRRQLVKGTLATGALVALAPVLQACGGSAQTTSGSSTAQGSPKPKTGGTLKVGLAGGSTNLVMDGQMPGGEISNAICLQLYEGLMRWNPNYELEYVVAEEMTHNQVGDVWKAKIRPNLTWHDGKPVTSDDVVWSVLRILDPASPKRGATDFASAGLRSAGVRKIDASTVEFRLDKPAPTFKEIVAGYYQVMLPTGYDVKHPIGSGPFKMVDFRPGQQEDFAPFEGYWGGRPFVNELSIIEFVDTAARVNALLSGEVDAISGLPYAQIPVVNASDTVHVIQSKTGAYIPFYMRMDVKPWTDVRVRQAFRLIPDRKQMISQSLAGFGNVGNDMVAPFDLGYPKDLPQRDQDLEQAKSLLKQAGYDNNLTVQLDTSDAISAGAVESAQVFAQQATRAGVSVTIRKHDAGAFWEVPNKWPFCQEIWYTRNYLSNCAQMSLPGAYYNGSHWKDEEWLKIVQEALVTMDDTKRSELISVAETIEYERGSIIVWGFLDQIDGYSKKIGGVIPSKTGLPLGAFGFKTWYFV